MAFNSWKLSRLGTPHYPVQESDRHYPGKSDLVRSANDHCGHHETTRQQEGAMKAVVRTRASALTIGFGIISGIVKHGIGGLKP
jgi:hypothetical protein